MSNYLEPGQASPGLYVSAKYEQERRRGIIRRVYDDLFGVETALIDADPKDGKPAVRFAAVTSLCIVLDPAWRGRGKALSAHKAVAS